MIWRIAAIVLTVLLIAGAFPVVRHLREVPPPAPPPSSSHIDSMSASWVFKETFFGVHAEVTGGHLALEQRGGPEPGAQLL